ncbi:winged helix-turn-helix transcriptional regulator [Listeria seeligeri]|uniref:MarR family winged helix-turn-helix transcriptional regulator n=1 Tax=Listeria seeligeri TaxID=1640 RepID=UPI001628FC43|nr:MarR family winged helix-turn-helix transcriptional regulator [Listeria seeligeri]MBC1765434.1 winged helix-turn-helix transcriptional regulator [Listeria seeligeri]MBC1883666.1 winged helix-turn-helix transcriptional regulator [Listeria seeligeri]MBF2421574.1 winged helix-turn-helix transcriptional regulator [Listeria seeligeri]
MTGVNTDTENISELLKTYWSIQRISAGYADQNAASLGLTIQQLAMINVIYGTPGISVAKLTKRLIITGSSAAANIDGLISLGLVVKLNKTIPNDSMDLTLKLSKKGEDLSKRSTANAFMYKAMMKVFENLSKEEVEELIRLNKKVETLLKKCK